MSDNARSSYTSVPTSETLPLTSLTYPPRPPSSSGVGRPGPVPLVQPGSAPLEGSLGYQSAPPSSASNTFNYNDSFKSPVVHQASPSLEEHDFTAGAAGDEKAHHRWSWDNTSYVPPNIRKFSRAWWKYQWKVQVSRKRLPRLLYILTGVILLVVWAGVALSFAQNIHHGEANNSVFNGSTDAGAGSTNNVLFFLSGQLNSFDPESRNLNIDWSALMIQGPLINDDLSNAQQVSVEKFGSSAIAMFRDTVARADTGLNATALGYIPFRVKDPNLKPTGFLGISDYDSINTDIGLGQSSKNIWDQPEFGYPFDVFKGTITFVACDNGTITALNRPGAGVLRMVGAILTDDLLNLKITPNTNATCLDPLAEGCELIIDIWAERTALVKFCVIVVFLMNWIVTIAIFLVTGEALLLTERTSWRVPIFWRFASLFALPTVRSLLPGVPDYGCLLDLFGILPCVIVVTLCTSFFTNSRLRMRGRQKREEAAAAAAAAAAKTD